MFSINDGEYTQMTDEKLIENIKNEDQMALNCLMERYNEVVNMKANKFFMVGAEKDDMIQEGMIGLYKAVKSFNLENDEIAKKENIYLTKPEKEFRKIAKNILNENLDIQAI